jgi:hypothetical protein
LDDKEQRTQKEEKRYKPEEVLKKHHSIKTNTSLKQINMSTTAAAQPILTVIKDKFAKVITEGTLFPTNKPTNWNVVITKKALLEAMRTPSPPSEEIWHGLATLYDNTFPTHEEYREFTVNRLTMWGNTLDYKLFDTLYLTHRYHSRTIKRLWEQVMAFLEEANKINKRDMMVRHEIESHVQTISRSDLQQWIKKPQRVWVVIPPTPLPSSSQQSNNSHRVTYGCNYAWCQYHCFECGDPTHLKWDCPLYICRTCDQVAPGHAPKACWERVYDDGICGHYDINSYNDGNLTGECWFPHVVCIYLFSKPFK